MISHRGGKTSIFGTNQGELNGSENYVTNAPNGPSEDKFHRSQTNVQNINKPN
jgi:hypothetical protein